MLQQSDKLQGNLDVVISLQEQLARMQQVSAMFVRSVQCLCGFKTVKTNYQKESKIDPHVNDRASSPNIMQNKYHGHNNKCC